MSTTTWDVGTLFTYKGGRFRAKAFVKVETYAIVPEGPDDVGTDIVRELIVEEGRDPDNLKRLVFCAPEEADAVFGTGICGCVALISACQVEGMVEWSADLLRTQRESAALRLGNVAHVDNKTIARLVAQMDA